MTNIPAITVYGIKNCDSVKKARAWLDAQQIKYVFHDYRVDGLTPDLLSQFVDRLGIDAILNQRSTSWRQLDDAQKQDLTFEKAKQLILSNPTLLKRPIVAIGEQLLVGFNPETYTKAL
jgi:arsenate reductase